MGLEASLCDRGPGIYIRLSMESVVAPRQEDEGNLERAMLAGNGWNSTEYYSKIIHSHYVS